MKFDEAIKSVFNNYANFSGRARRSEYWFSYLFFFLVLFAAQALDLLLLGTSLGLFYVVAALVTLVPSLSVTWRRLHDTDKSGGYFFFVLIPLVGLILLIVWLATDSQPTQNKYGPTVK